MAQFRAWCGEHCTFLTWGYDDQGVMEQNIIIHDLDWDWIDQWVNLQLIYNKWVLLLLVAAILEIYTMHRISHLLKKEEDRLPDSEKNLN